ncbi:hypothetical protein, partial [Paraconexibacter sp.]|uniref:hypothetical protein n=1 Tax=Paraconexibacter sp. TaxID=2949640 RepID=UPI0035687AD5
AIAQADLEVRRNAHQPLEALHDMARVVADVILDKAAGIDTVPDEVRPPMRGMLTTTEVAA